MTPLVLALGSDASFKDLVVRSLKLRDHEVDWKTSILEASETLASGPRLIVVGPDVAEADAIDFVDRTAQASPSTAVVLVRSNLQNGLVTAAMRAGARDVIDMTRDADELHNVLERAFNWSSSLRHDDEERASGRILSVFSSKGGTGKSFLSTNLASAIAQRTGESTALVDIDLAMGDAFAYFGQEPENHIRDLIALGDKDRAGVLAAGTQLLENLWGYGAPTDPAAEIMHGDEVGKLLGGVARTFDHVVVDVPGNYSDQVLAALDASECVLLVCSLDVVGIRHLAKAIETLESIGLPKERFRIVLNRAGSKVGITPADVERVLQVKVHALVPSSILVPASLNKGVPVYIQEPKSEVAQSIGTLADSLVGTKPIPKSSSRPRSRRLFSRSK
ncbi:MAG TPA: P-loop NTPase [Actinomycetota bacterium]|nr:P-loop NTPase [Actinomycetota bacterium]